MKKHTVLTGLLIGTIVLVGSWGSMREVSAADVIKVERIGVNSATSNTATKSSKSNKVASNTNPKITIEVVRDSDSKVKSGSVAGIAYDKLVMANVEEAVNIRDDSSEDGKIIGKFYKECGGTILDKKNGWTKVETGDITGWISNDYLLFGDDAVELANKVVEKTATCKTDCLRVRKSADPNGTVLDLLAEGDQIGVLSEQGDWVEIEYSDGDTGFVSAEYVTIADSLGTGKSMEEITKMENEAKQLAAAAAAEAKSSSGNKAEAAASVTPAKTQTAATAAGFSDVVLLAALIQAEAGTQPYEGQVAVGNVVTNRLITGRYGSSIYSVIYAKSQFGPAGSGQVAQIAAAGPKATCLAAAQDALNGVNYIGTATHFRNIRSGNQGIVIGAHVFW